VTADPWAKLHDGKNYKIYTNRGPLLDRIFDRYVVAGPSGRSVGSAMTLRGARRLIRKDQERRQRGARSSQSNWWDAPIVEEIPSERVEQ
jgi:hypothetical protein